MTIGVAPELYNPQHWICPSIQNATGILGTSIDLRELADRRIGLTAVFSVEACIRTPADSVVTEVDRTGVLVSSADLFELTIGRVGLSVTVVSPAFDVTRHVECAGMAISRCDVDCTDVCCDD